jgi:peroxiredoxin
MIRSSETKEQKELLKRYPIEKSDNETSIFDKMLRVGDKAPVFKAKFYRDGKSFDLKDYIGKHVIVVDFWYTHCPPCVRSMPALSKLYNSNKDKGLKLFGLNSVDNREPSLPNLKKFLDKKNPSYDIILTDPSVDRNYKVKAYPTMYVIDKKGNVSYVELGYDEKKFEEFKSFIEELLNE